MLFAILFQNDSSSNSPKILSRLKLTEESIPDSARYCQQFNAPANQPAISILLLRPNCTVLFAILMKCQIGDGSLFLYPSWRTINGSGVGRTSSNFRPITSSSRLHEAAVPVNRPSMWWLHYSNAVGCLRKLNNVFGGSACEEAARFVW